MARILVLTSEREKEILASLFAHDVMTVHGVNDALLQKYLFEPDLVLAEWFCTGASASGTHLLESFKKLEIPRPPFYLMAGVPNPDQIGVHRMHAKHNGADGFIPLPDSEDDGQFVAAVEQALEGRVARRRTWLLPNRGNRHRVTVFMQERGTVDEDAMFVARLAKETEQPATEAPDFDDPRIRPVVSACGGVHAFANLINESGIRGTPGFERHVFGEVLRWAQMSPLSRIHSAFAYLVSGDHSGTATRAVYRIATYLVIGTYADRLPEYKP